MIKQYLSIKETCMDAILFYRMGDFYEMFFEDAELASRLLEITLTSRNKKDTSSIPMCGVPVRAAQNYIARLVEKGYKIAICDQVEDPAVAKGLVKRDIVRIITPGMIIENELLDEKSNNFILSVSLDNSSVGISCLDISTGAFRLSESTDLDAIIEETFRISPSEVIFPEHSKNDTNLLPMIHALSDRSISFLNDKVFEYRRARERLIGQFGTISLEGFGCEKLKAGVSAAGALLYYVGETQKQKIEHIAGIESYSLHNYLFIDELCCRNLELIKNIRTGASQGTLLGTIDRTVTAMGGRLLKRWIRYPLIDPQQILARLDAVEEAKNNTRARRNIRENLKSIYDLERLGSRICMGHCNARDLVAMKCSLNMLPKIWSEISRFNARMFRCDENIEDLYDLADLIEKAIREDAPPTINEGGMIRPGYNAEIDELINISRDGKGWLAKLETQERLATGINSLKVRYNKVFGYYIEISKSHSTAAPAHYIRRQTLVNAERYVTEELKSFEIKVLGSEERRTALEYELFNNIRSRVAKNNSGIQKIARFLAGVDCLMSLAEMADENQYCRPEINTDGYLCIEEGRHPVVEKMITGERFVPNSIIMDNNENQVLIITGPNMAGKSTVLRQVALIVLMSHMGSFVPAVKASIGITDRIFTRVGALDNLSHGQSTFMVEMEETANILNNATNQSLVVMDEIGRGTSTFDGLSIAWAVAEYLHDLKQKGVKTLFATHYHELTELALEKPRVKNYNIAVKEWNEEIIFLRKLLEGGTNRSYGIQVARLAGIPDIVIRRSKEILSEIENEKHRFNDLSKFCLRENETGKGQMQLDLFCKPEHFIIDKLKNMNISKMTPLDALNCLNELQEKANSLYTDSKKPADRSSQ